MRKFPTNEELRNLWWYRLGIATKWMILFLSLIAPSIINDNAKWYFDGIINTVIMYLVIHLVNSIFLFIVYGKRPDEEIYQKEKRAKKNEIVGLLIVVSVYLLFIYSFWNSLSD